MKELFKAMAILMFALKFSTVSAQQARIAVTDNITKKPISDVIIASANNIFATTNEFGVADVAVGKCTLNAIGYESAAIDADSAKEYFVELEKRITSLSEVTVATTNRNSIFRVINALDISLRPINNSQEILRSVPGLFIGQHAGGGKAEQIFLRGFDIDHGTDINISVDGMPVNMPSHAHGQGYADLHFVIPELIEKVEFNKGPYFAYKGNFATAGFVALKTKSTLDQSTFKVETGQFNCVRAYTALNLVKPVKGKNSLFLATEYAFTNGFFDSPQNFNRLNALLKYNNRITQRTIFTSSLSAFISKWNASGQIPERSVNNGSIGFFGAIDNTEGGNTRRYNFNTELTHNFTDGSTFSSNLFYTKNQFKLFSNFTFFLEDPLIGDQIKQEEKRDIIGLNTNYKKDFKLGGLENELNIGTQIRQDFVKGVELSKTLNRTELIDNVMLGDVNELNAAVFASQKINFSNKFNVTGGLRADYFKFQYNNKLSKEQNSLSTIIVSPKINFNYKLSNKIQLYWYNGQGFHSNDARVSALEGRKALPLAFGSDIGGVFKVGKKLIVQSAIWYLKLQQEFVYVGDAGIVEPSGATQRTGFDFSARYQMTKNLFADVDLTFAKPKVLGVAKTESYIPLAPTFTSAGGLTYKRTSGFNGNLRYRYMADRAANENVSTVAKGYFVVDAAVNFTKSKWEAGIAIQNLLNTRWKETQFETTSRLRNESTPVTEIHFTPGTKFLAKASLTYNF